MLVATDHSPVDCEFIEYLIHRQERRLLTILSTTRRLAKGGNHALTRQVHEPERAALRPVNPAVRLPSLKCVRLLDQLRKHIRLLHYSLRTEEAHVY